MMRTENGGDGSLAAQNTTTTILLAGGVIDESNRGERYGKRQACVVLVVVPFVLWGVFVAARKQQKRAIHYSTFVVKM